MKNTYPSPCEGCREKRCPGTGWCEDWLKRYRYRQKQINAYAMKLARGGAAEKTDVWIIMHPDEIRRYLATHPCESCLVRDLCDTPCKRYLAWYDAHRERARRRLQNEPY